MVTFLIVLMLIVGIVAWKYRFILTGPYLVICSLADLILTLIRNYLHFPKPYHDLGKMIWLLDLTLYLLPASLLIYLLARKQTFWHEFSFASLFLIIFLIYLLYPTIAGPSILALITTYYLLASAIGFLVGLFELMRNIRKNKISLDRLILMTIGLVTLGEFGLLQIFKSYEVIHLMNAVFYFLILVVIVGSPKVKTLFSVSNHSNDEKR